MIVKFHPNMANMFAGLGILNAGYNAACAISVYSGVQPSQADIVANWASYNSTNSNFLAHYTGVVWSQPLNGEAKFINVTTFPASVLPKNTGVAAWAIAWPSNVTDAQVALATIPNNKFIVGSVTDMASSGMIRFNPDTTLTVGESKIFADAIISVNII